ncbi:lasso peptide biosynthesis B2 protein [Streptomyces nogalater]
MRKARGAALTRPGDRQPLTPGRHLRAVLAVGAARLLTRRPPRDVRRVLTRLSRGARPATYDEAAAARAAVLRVSVMCAGDGCLQRSVAIALLCRWHGAWPTWRVGVRTMPFRAHAWVEAEEPRSGKAATPPCGDH